MIRFITILTIIIAAGCIYGQDNIIVVENKMWSNMQELCLPEGNQYTTFFHRFEGDTVIDGKTYKKVWTAEDEHHQNWFFYGAFIREENNRVYYREFFGEEGLIYDFTIKLGDTLTISNPLAPEGILLTLTDIDSIQTNEGYRKRWKLVKDEFSTDEYWIEGIGSESGVLNSGTGVFGGLCGSYTLLCYHENSSLVYLNSEYETCYYMLLDDGNNLFHKESFELKYNRFNQQLNIRFSDNEDKQIILTNVSGVPVYKNKTVESSISVDLFNLPKGLYIVTIFQNKQLSSRKLMIL